MSFPDLTHWRGKACLDWWLFLAWAWSVSFLFVTDLLPEKRLAYAVAAGLAAALLGVAVWRRVRKGWHWQGAGLANVLKALMMAVIIVVFVIWPGRPIISGVPGRTRGLLFVLLAIGFFIFEILRQLNLSYGCETNFLKDCEGNDQEEP